MPKSSDDERVSDWLGLAIELRIYVLAALFIVLENARILAPLIYVEEAQDSSQAQYGEDCFNDVVSGFLSFGFIVEGHTVRNIFASFEHQMLKYGGVAFDIIFAAIGFWVCQSAPSV